MIRKHSFVALCCFVVAALTAIPVDAQSPGKLVLSKAAPPECVFFLASNGWKEPNPNSTNLTEKLLAEESLKEFFQQFGDELNRVIEKQTAGDEQATVAAGAVPVLLKAAIKHPLSLYLESFAATNPPVINGAAVIDCENDAAQVNESLQKLINLAPKEGPEGLIEEKISGSTLYGPKTVPLGAPLIRFGMHKSYLIVAVGQDSAASLIKRLEGSGKEPAWLTKIATDLAVDRPSMLLHIDVAAIWKAVDQHLTEPQVRAGLEASGLLELKQVSSVSGLDKKATQSKSVIETEGEPRGILSLLPNKPLTRDDFKTIPATAARATMLRFDLAHLVQEGLKIADAIDPNVRVQFEAGMGQAEQQLGFSVQKDLLEGFGDLWSFYTSGSEAGALFVPGLVITASVRNHDGLSKVQEVLVAQVRNALAQGAPVPFSIHEFTAKGQKGFRIQINNLPLPIAPTWVLTKDQFVLGINPQLVTSHLSATGKKSLADNDSVKAAFQWESKPLCVSYSDPKPELQSMYGLINSFGPVLTGQLAERGIDFNIPPLPPISDLEPHLAPSVSTIARTPTGWRSESHSVVPSFSAATPAVGGVLVAFLLPAVQQAREAARRSQGMNNLKMIGLAMHNYHDTHEAFPPAASLDKKDKPLLSWRVHLLPFLEQAPLYQQFHLDEPWDSEHNKTLIEKIPPTLICPGQEALAKEGKTVYLVPTGEGAAFEGKEGLAIRNFLDGTSNTILAVEAHADAAVIWTKPDDLVLDFKNPLKGLQSARTGGFHALFADGAVRFISDNIDVETLKNLFTRAGGEAVGEF